MTGKAVLSVCPQHVQGLSSFVLELHWWAELYESATSCS